MSGQAIAFSPDGKLVAGDGEKGKVVVCDAATGRVVHRLDGPQHTLSALAFSPDGKALAAGEDVNQAGGGKITFLVLDLATGKARCRITDEGGGWSAACVLPRWARAGDGDALQGVPVGRPHRGGDRRLRAPVLQRRRVRRGRPADHVRRRRHDP